VERLQALEEEQRILTAHVRELRDPARLAKLAREMGLSRPDRVIALAPPGIEPRP
jgi:cell division protein FtsB